MHRILLGILISAVAAAAAGHRPLLPQPRSIEYGPGSLALSGAEIGFASAPAADDRFAASELAGALSAASGSPVPVRDSAPSHRGITLRRTGAIAALPEKDEAPGPEGRESYRIRVTPAGAEISASSSAGLFYAVQTMKQLIEGHGGAAYLPAVEIHDWPALAYRGFMMDLSHGSIMKEDEIRRQIDFLSRWKANQYYFYSEASIEVKGYALINPRARYSQDQVRRIIEYARERHVDVVPCLEYFGHLHDLLRLERYADMGAMPHGGDLNPRHPGVEALLKDWIGQMAGLFPSPWFHVGLDEPFELEAAGVTAAGGVEPGELYREQLDRVTSIVRSHGKRVLFWADIDSGARIFNKYPELVSKMPADVVPVPWYYAAMPDYTKWVEPFGNAGKPQVVAPGVWCWNEVYPDYATTFTNNDGFIAAGRKHGAIGVINTGWTDDAQTIYRMALPGMAYGAIAAWQSEAVARARFFDDYARQMYGDDLARELGPALAALSEARERLAEVLGTNTMHRFWEDALDPSRLEKAAANSAQLRRARLRAEDALERLDRALETAPDDYTLPSLRLGAGMLDYLGMKHLYAVDLADYFRRVGPKPAPADVSLFLSHEIASQDHSHTADLMDTITELRNEYEEAWNQEWTRYRRGSALGRWDAEYQYWRVFQAHINGFTQRFKKGDALPPLDSFRPKP